MLSVEFGRQVVPCTWKWKPLCFLPTRLIYSCQLFTLSLKLICPQGTFCSALWGVLLHKPVGAAGAAARRAALARGRFQSTSSSSSSSLRARSPRRSCFWRWDRDGPCCGWCCKHLCESWCAAPCERVRPGSKASRALRWSAEHVPKGHRGYKVGSCPKYIKRYSLDDMWHP